jgi:hypothetical protein
MKTRLNSQLASFAKNDPLGHRLFVGCGCVNGGAASAECDWKGWENQELYFVVFI